MMSIPIQSKSVSIIQAAYVTELDYLVPTLLRKETWGDTIKQYSKKDCNFKSELPYPTYQCMCAHFIHADAHIPKKKKHSTRLTTVCATLVALDSIHHEECDVRTRSYTRIHRAIDLHISD